MLSLLDPEAMDFAFSDKFFNVSLKDFSKSSSEVAEAVYISDN